MIEPIRWNGEKISVPGLYVGIGMDEYHGDLCVGPSVSASGLWTMVSKSAAHYYDTSYLNPDRDEREDTEGMILGRACHHAYLGEQHFLKHFVLRPEELNGKPWHGLRTDCKEWLAAVKDSRLTVLKGEQIVKMRRIAANLAKNPLVMAGALNGLVEHSLVYQDEETGVWVKVRPDVIPLDGPIYNDLKIVADITDQGIQRSIKSFGYGLQGGMVGMASKAVLDMPMEHFSLILGESQRPHCITVKTLYPDDLALGEKQARAGLRLFKRCLERGEWPGPGGEQTDAKYIGLSSFGRTDMEYRLSQIEAELAV
jgi:hypothetical protein